MDLKKALQIIKKNKSFLLSTHMGSDPDGLCSEIAMAQYLRSLGKKVLILNNENVSKKNKFIPGASMVKVYKDNMSVSYDVAITFDCGEFPRLGKVTNVYRKDKTLINIDHHVTNTRYGDLNLVDTQAASTTEVVYQLLKKDRFPLTKNIAMNIYIGLMVDTGSFRYENTTAKTHKIVGELMEFNFSANELYKKVYWKFTMNDLRELNRMVSDFKTSLNGKFVSVELNERMTSKLSDSFDLNDAIFTHLRSIRGVEVLAVFLENSHQKTKVNLRSNCNIDVAKLAFQFNGGGHRRASGFVINRDLKGAKKELLREVKKALQSPEHKAIHVQA